MILRVFTICAAMTLLFVAGQWAPTPTQPDASGSPPQRSALLIAALGRHSVAADLAWLRLVQLLGDRAYAQSRYPGLEDWIALTTELHPNLLGPFYFGATLLLGDPARRDRVDDLLALAEKRSPLDFRFPLERGILDYFGRFEPLAAAEDFERAATVPGAPQYLAALAKTVRARGVACSTIGTAAAAFSQGAAMIEDRTVECVKRRIEAAAASARINEDPDDSVESLIARGHLQASALVAGLCWSLRHGTATPITCTRENE